MLKVMQWSCIVWLLTLNICVRRWGTLLAWHYVKVLGLHKLCGICCVTKMEIKMPLNLLLNRANFARTRFFLRGKSEICPLFSWWRRNDVAQTCLCAHSLRARLRNFSWQQGTVFLLDDPWIPWSNQGISLKAHQNPKKQRGFCIKLSKLRSGLIPWNNLNDTARKTFWSVSFAESLCPLAQDVVNEMASANASLSAI